MKNLLLLLLIVLLPGCHAVEPWQRETLAKPVMAVTPLPLDATRNAHVQQSREAGAHAAAAGGGGCGCY
ncbi:MAG TPA: DUF4266 domain-containing protein [Candidatus Acidoferrum sp.]|nr:DUF4266 domain-containing protein [Candidatus Acidoferrum sp.]